MSELSPFSSEDFTQTLKQFFLETNHLELTYQSLKEQFKSVQLHFEETYPKLYGKVAELSFMTCYLEAILGHMSQGLLFIDLNGIVTTCNPAAESLFTVQASEILFHPFWELFPDQLFGFSLKEVLQTKRSPKLTFITWTSPQGEQMELEIEASFVTIDPKWHPIDFQKSQSDSAVQGLLILVRNITAVRQLQAAALRASRFKDLGEMAARVAHEIRNPLGGIKGFATLLKQDLHDQPALEQMAEQIIQGTDNLSRFVSQVLNYARPLQPHLEAVDLIPFTQELLQLLQADQTQTHSISYQMQSQLSHLWVPADPQLLKSALLNLCVNAIQAMPQGGDLSVILTQDRNSAMVSIKDTGIGMSQEQLDRLFTPFFTTKEAGNGLGLSEVYKIIQAHQGTIEVQSAKEQGSTFTLRLPLKIL